MARGQCVQQPSDQMRRFSLWTPGFGLLSTRFVSEFSNEDVPSVVVIGSAAKSIKRSWPTVLQVAATPPACGENALSQTQN